MKNQITYVRLLIVLILVWTGASNAVAEPRIALVIGNSAYSSIGMLPNPVADAQLVSQTLDGLEFETTLVLDSNQLEMKRKIADFGRKLRSADKDTVGLFFYAGHGVQAQGRNYLLPVEAEPTDQADLDLMGVEANWILRQMESAGIGTSIIILDACRNNPFTAANRSLGRGLAQMDAPTGSFIAYATAPGKVALDGDSVNSPFTSALAKALERPGMAIEQVFKQVRVDVIRATNGAQTPWDSSSLTDDFYFRPEALKIVSTPPDPTPVEQSLWQSVSVSGDAGRLALFLQVYPNSSFASEARLLLADAIAQDPSLVAGSGSGTGQTDVTQETSPQVETTEAASALAGPKPASAEFSTELSEHELIAVAQTSGSIEDFQRYIRAYPDGVFVDLARAEISHINEEVALTNVTPTVDATAVDGTQSAGSPLLFDQSLAGDTQFDPPRSLRQLAQAIPRFPPVEGLSEEYWLTQQCSNCHNWTRENLCKQGEFYIGKNADVVERIRHPFGGFFKGELKRWADDGCK